MNTLGRFIGDLLVMTAACLECVFIYLFQSTSPRHL